VIIHLFVTVEPQYRNLFIARTQFFNLAKLNSVTLKWRDHKLLILMLYNWRSNLKIKPNCPSVKCQTTKAVNLVALMNTLEHSIGLLNWGFLYWPLTSLDLTDKLHTKEDEFASLCSELQVIKDTTLGTISMLSWILFSYTWFCLNQQKPNLGLFVKICQYHLDI